MSVSNTVSYWGVSYVGPTAESDEEQFGAQARVATGASWRTFRIRHVQTADGVEVQASMELPDGTVLEDRSPLSPYPDFPAASPLTLSVSGRESMVGEVSVYRPRWDPCGAMVPADGLQNASPWGAVGPTGLCLVTPVSPGLRTHHSTDGVVWVHAEPAGLSDDQLPYDLEWDAARGLYHATLLAFSDATGIERVSSPDCVNWTHSGVLPSISPSSGPPTWWYAIRPARDGAPGEHEIGRHAFTGGTGTSGISYRWVSATGEPGTFEALEPVTLPPFWGTPHPTLVGNDRVVSVSVEELDTVTGERRWVPNAFVQDGTEWIPIPDLRLPPMGRRGTAGDDIGVTRPELVVDPTPIEGAAASGWLFYSGQADGVIVARVSVLPFE